MATNKKMSYEEDLVFQQVERYREQEYPDSIGSRGRNDRYRSEYENKWLNKHENPATLENQVVEEIKKHRAELERHQAIMEYQARQLVAQNERMKEMEKRLLILQRNTKYEDKYPELKAAYDEYARIEEKYLVFETLKAPY